MALTGTLEDLAITDLVQVPHAGRKTGELLISNRGAEARLFYREGKLTHAEMGRARGIDVLVDLMGWEQGAFAFQAGASSAETSIELDVPHAVMLALKTRDERSAAERRRRATAATEATAGGDLHRHLSEFVASSAAVLHAFVLGGDGSLLAEAVGKDGPPQSARDLGAALYPLIAAYPRGGLRKILVDDEGGTVVLTVLPQERALVVVANGGSSLGAVSVAAGKLATSLDDGAQR